MAGHFRRWRGFLRLAGLAALLLAPPATAQRVVSEGFVQSLDGPHAPGARLVLEPLPLDDGTEVTLEVWPVEVFAKGAEIVVHGKNGDRRIAPPSDRWFAGRVAGDPSSIVVLARGRGLRGLIVTEGRLAWVSPEGGAYGDGPPGRTFVRSLSPETDMPDAMRHFTCGTESLPVPP
ncbi:MAG TPA: hypothetical protein VLH41_06495, partial [Thermoanaerobaculia bacterium]|nr:hypothetical protein [Thermoanaerobaculia bacterium]